MSIRFAQLPAEVIYRLHELTKTEIIVLEFLYLSRNKRTTRCDPSRGNIAKAIGIERAHVYRACETLERKGWIEMEKDGNFILSVPFMPLKGTLPFGVKTRSKTVAKSATVSKPEVSRNAQQSVAKSATHLVEISVAKSATGCSEKRDKVSRNALHISEPTPYIDLNIKEQTRTERGAKPDVEKKSHAQKDTRAKMQISEAEIDSQEGVIFDFPIKPLFEIFPDLKLTPSQIGMISVAVKKDDELDAKAWLATLAKYRGNIDRARGRYLPERVGTLLGVFKDERNRLENEHGKNSQRNKRDRTDTEILNDAARQIAEKYPD